MPRFTPQQFFHQQPISPNDIRYAVLKRANSCNNPFSSKVYFKGYPLAGASIYRSLNDANEGLEEDSGLIIQFIVDEEDRVKKITHQYSLENSDDDQRIMSSESTSLIIKALDAEYQKYLTNNPNDKIHHPDIIEGGAKKYYRFARLSKEGFGADYKYFSLISAHAPDAAGYIYGLTFPVTLPIALLLKVAFIAQLTYHVYNDIQLLGHNLEKPIIFDEKFIPGVSEGVMEILNKCSDDLFNSSQSGTWVKFEVDANNQFLKLDSAYYVFSEGKPGEYETSSGYIKSSLSFSELSLDLSKTTEAAVELFKRQYQNYLVEKKERNTNRENQDQQNRAQQEEVANERQRRIDGKIQRDRAASLQTTPSPAMR